MKLFCKLVIVFLVVAQSGPAIGDVVYTRDGGRHEGEVRKEENTVFIETADGTVEVRTEDVVYISVVAPPVAEEEQPDSENTSDEAAADSAPTPDDQATDGPASTPTAHADYFVIPIYGTIGVEAHVDTLVKCFNVAAIQDASVIILHIKSGGGFVDAKNEILALLREKKKDFRIVAYVTEAHSAAAIIALLCDEIVMAPQGAIGSCVPYTTAEDGTPENIEAKFLAIEMAEIRAIAEEGGHNPLLAEAMINYEMVLGRNETDDGIELVRGEGEEVIKSAEAILNLTAQEAVTYGLAIATTAELLDIKDHIAIESWTETSQRGIIIQRQWEQELSDALEKLNRLYERYDEDWDDLVAAYNANEYRRAFRLANQLQTRLRKVRGLAVKYEYILEEVRYREYFDEWLKNLEAIEEKIADRL